MASRLGPGRLGRALQDPDSDNRTLAAALTAVPLLDAGLLLLDSLLPYLLSSDENLRSRAVAATAALLAKGTSDELEEWEVASETTRAACQALTRLAQAEGEVTTLRLLAVQGLVEGRCEVKPTITLLATRDPEVRRATVLALIPPDDPTLWAATRDPDNRVAAAAGARLCQRSATTGAPGQPPLRKLALLEGALPEDTMDILPCLLASTDPADKEVVDLMEKHGAPQVREALKRLRQPARDL